MDSNKYGILTVIKKLRETYSRLWFINIGRTGYLTGVVDRRETTLLQKKEGPGREIKRGKRLENVPYSHILRS